MMPNDRTIL